MEEVLGPSSFSTTLHTLLVIRFPHRAFTVTTDSTFYAAFDFGTTLINQGHGAF